MHPCPSSTFTNWMLHGLLRSCAHSMFFFFTFIRYSSTSNREPKQTRRRRKRERHLKTYLRVSVIIFQLFKVIMFEKCVLTTLELNWNQRLGHKKTKLNICHHMLTSSTQLQNRSFHVVEGTKTSAKCQKMKNARAKRAKYCFSLSNMQICGVFVAVVVVVA